MLYLALKAVQITAIYEIAPCLAFPNLEEVLNGKTQ